MSSVKPDYFIASNGLPNILNNKNNNNNGNSTRHMIRHVPTATRNRVHNQQRNNCLHKDEIGKNHKNKQNFMEARKAPTSTVDSNRNNNKLSHINLKKSKKDLINSEIKASNSHENSSIYLSTSSQKIEADNKCSWNFERHSKELDNKYTHQRKYDNKIFRHDLPDRIVLPTLPI